MRKNGALPELLAPAGSPEALRAAIEGGADAVYFGGAAFNARMRAANFTADTMREAVSLCHAYGVKTYITLNTLCRDRELPDFLCAAKEAYLAGADALIVADLGGAAAIRRAFPDFELHASTQMSGHNIAAAGELAKCGFTRMVLARETPARDIRYFAEHSGLETEIFVQGALCVSHSGQCLFSSLVGGRSGNRGECAQPCRLPDGNGRYPLSLKDLCLAAHVPELITMGVDSLKIEGRLKSPAYVRDVTAVWRRLLDERRAATPEEMRYLAGIFSRGGFTDAYFTEHISHAMLGVRSEADKTKSRENEAPVELTKKISLEMDFHMEAEKPLTLTVRTGGKTATVWGDIPFAARNAPMGEDAVKKNLFKLGATPYTPGRCAFSIGEGLMVPVSALNALRRSALAALEAEIAPPRTERALPTPEELRAHAKGARVKRPTARFYDPAQMIPETEAFFEHRYLPLERFTPPADGVILPPVIFDHEMGEIRLLLQKARERGAKHALVGNLGHLALAREAGLVPHGDFRLNAMSEGSLAVLLSLGFEDVLLSPELTLPQIRDIGGASDVIVYGRIPLMLLEKCVGREVGDCRACAGGKNEYTDRRGEKFPVLRLSPHRNELFNCVPTNMSDRQAELAGAGVRGGHFLFTTETAAEVRAVLQAFAKGLPLGGKVRRI